MIVAGNLLMWKIVFLQKINGNNVFKIEQKKVKILEHVTIIFPASFVVS